MALLGRKATAWQAKPPMGVLINWAHPLAGRLVSLWLMNERGGMDVADAAAVKTKGTLQSGASWANNGKWGAAVNLSGSGYVSVAQQGRYQLSGGPFTVAVVIKDDTPYSSLGTYHRILSWYDGSKNIQLGLGQGMSSPNRMFYLLNSAVNGQPQIISAGDCGLGYHVVVVTFDGSNYKMYLDGRETSGGGSGAGNVYIYSGDSTNLYIGRRGDSAGYVNGNVDLVAIWSRALTDGESGSFTVNPFGLVTVPRTYFALDAGSATLNIPTGALTASGLAPVLSTGDTFTSKASGSWHDTATWNEVGTPNSSSTVTISHNVTMASDGSCATLIISDVGTLTLSAGVILTIYGNPGSFQPGAGLTLGEGAAVVFAQQGVLEPATGVLTLTGYASNVFTDLRLSPGVGSIALVGYAGSIYAAYLRTPDAGVLSLSGYASSLYVDRRPAPGTGVLSLTGLAPAVSIISGTVISPGGGLLSLTGYTSDLYLEFRLSPSTAALAAAGYVPFPLLTKLLAPGAASLMLVGYAPRQGVPGICTVLDTSVSRATLSDAALFLVDISDGRV